MDFELDRANDPSADLSNESSAFFGTSGLTSNGLTRRAIDRSQWSERSRKDVSRL